MDIVAVKGEPEVIEEVSSWCVLKIATYGAASAFLPAGNTLVPVYRAWTETKPDFLQKLSFRQLDEILGGEKAGVFHEFFQKELPDFSVEAPKGEEAPADLAILGLGLNGHVAFHEPGMPEDFSYGEVKLSVESTKSLDISVGTEAVTYGVGTLMKAKAILLVVTGEKKREIFQRFQQKDPELPAVFLQKHPDLTVLTDIHHNLS